MAEEFTFCGLLALTALFAVFVDTQMEKRDRHDKLTKVVRFCSAVLSVSLVGEMVRIATMY